MQVPENVFMFSGQGSQYFHMGGELFQRNQTFREWMVHLDETPRRMFGTSIIDVLYSGQHRKADPFDRTLLTHPAIFMVEYALAETLMQAGIQPDLVLGASMGSFAAAAVAGYIDVDDALAAVIQQAIAFEQHCKPGGMTAVLADPALYFDGSLDGHCALAAANFSSHFVISGRLDELLKIETALAGKQVGFQRLPVSFPFHSQWIDEARSPFVSSMRSIAFHQGRLPVACCDQVDVLSDVSGDYFWNVARRPIRFRETAGRLERQGPRRYIDVGPAGTLATFLKYGMPAPTRSSVHAVLTPFGFDEKNLAALVAATRN